MRRIVNISSVLVVFIHLLIVNVRGDNLPPFDSMLYLNQSFPEKGYEFYRVDRDKAFHYFKDGAEYYLSKGDSSAYIRCLLGLSDIQRRQGQYNQAFDILWDVLENKKISLNKESLMDLHRRLGMLYGIYGKDSLALSHLMKGLEYGKLHDEPINLNSPYFAIAEQYINVQRYDEALIYLDSCYMSNPNKQRLIYVDAYYGLIFIKKQDFNKAKVYFRGLIPVFEKDNLAFVARVYEINADLMLALHKTDSAISYLEKSLSVINSMKVHFEIKPRVLEKLAELYYESGNKKTAYEYMKAAKETSDELFNTQSIRNSALFEIKNKYKKDLTESIELIKTQEKLLRTQNKASLRLKLLVGILLVSIIIVLLTIKLKTRMRQMVYERKINDEKNEEILELKNKELTVNALQFIEKENAYNELLEIIEKQSPNKYSLVLGRHRQKNKKIWDDFHLRFTQINDTFYKKLLELYPNLTQTDLKHCALMKLNFDSKEMSQILGISVHSVHISRSRIRKKLNMKREDNLGGFLAAIG